MSDYIQKINPAPFFHRVFNSAKKGILTTNTANLALTSDRTNYGTFKRCWINNDNPESGLEKVLDKCVRLIFPPKKGVFFGVVLILLFILIVLIKIGFTPTNNLSTKTAISTPTQQPLQLCKPFSSNPDEISCQDAADVVLEKYPGKITKIDRKTLSIPGEKPPSALKFENKTAWLISIITNRELSFPKSGTTRILDVAVDVKEKKILITYPKFEK